MFGLSFPRCGLRAIQNNHCFILAVYVLKRLAAVDRKRFFTYSFQILTSLEFLLKILFGKVHVRYYHKKIFKCSREADFLQNKKKSTKRQQATRIQKPNQEGIT